MALALAGGAQAGVIALADMNVYSLGFVTGTFGQDYVLSIANELRTGTAGANYNGVAATGVGANSITGYGNATVDVQYRCAGDCDAGTAALYGGSMENSYAIITPPASANFALGDMYISGTALGGSISGLTRADAVSTGPTNIGGSSATILNSGDITGQFTVGTTFTSALGLGVGALLQSWVDPANPVGEIASATAGYSWVMDIYDSLGDLVLHFAPTDLNKTSKTSTGGTNKYFFNNGFYFSDVVTYQEGETYFFSINQSSNASIRDIPEPGSLALAGLGLLGLGALRRKKNNMGQTTA